MKTLHLFRTNIQEDERKKYLDSKEFEEELILQNMFRGKLLAFIVIAFETIFVSIDIVSFFLKVGKTFSFYFYLAMYLIMIAINLTYLILINGYGKKRIHIKSMNILHRAFPYSDYDLGRYHFTDGSEFIRTTYGFYGQYDFYARSFITWTQKE